MPKIVEGGLSAKGLKFGVVLSRFNEFIGNQLLEGAVDALLRSGASDSDIEIVKVPGSFEIPATVQVMMQKGQYDAIVCLGAISGAQHLTLITLHLRQQRVLQGYPWIQGSL